VVIENYDSIDGISIKDDADARHRGRQVRVKIGAAAVGSSTGEGAGLYQTKDPLPSCRERNLPGIVDATADECHCFQAGRA